MRSNQHLVNGLLAYILGTNQSTILTSKVLLYSTPDSVVAIDVAVRHKNGNETLIGEKVAEVQVGIEGGYRIANWNCPETQLNFSDAIVVRVYNAPPSKESWNLVATFITERLRGKTLDAATWTIYYYIGFKIINLVLTPLFFFGSSDFNSRIENFTWRPLEIFSDGLVLITT